jgi:hypothetical protein
MNDDDLIALGSVLGAVVILGLVALDSKLRRKRNYTKILEKALESANARVLYLATMLDDNGIELDEFDIIAIYES